ncbi:MAG: M20/M25/M40 family metallo-hydrolase, partial [Caldilineaceae bacterium]|nr:M20/M25/M40 family metallo-hydrolase [Caldilineaceae bacterium]
DDAMHDHVVASSGIRLPLDFDAVRFAMGAIDWAAQRTNSVSQNYSRLSMSPASTSSASASPASAGSTSASPISNLQSLNLSISQSPNLTITLRFSSYEPAWRGERSNPLCRSFLAALRAVAPAEKLGFVVKTGTSDMNVVGPAWNCPILAYGPGDSSLDHTPDEHVALDEYWRAVRVLEEAVRVWVSG